MNAPKSSPVAETRNVNQNLVFTIPSQCLPRRFVSSKPISLCWFIAHVSGRYNYGDFLTNCIRLSDETCSRSSFQVVNFSSHCVETFFTSRSPIFHQTVYAHSTGLSVKKTYKQTDQITFYTIRIHVLSVFFINRITRRLIWTNPGLYWRWRSSSRYFLPPTGIVNRYKYLDFTSSYTQKLHNNWFLHILECRMMVLW